MYQKQIFVPLVSRLVNNFLQSREKTLTIVDLSYFPFPIMSSFCFLGLCYLLLSLLPFMVHSKSKSIGKWCRPIEGFDFLRKRPRKQKLPFCGEYAKRTCCHPSDTTKIFQRIRPFVRSRVVSPRCKRRTAEVMCSSCHPDIGTAKLIGLCPVDVP